MAKSKSKKKRSPVRWIIIIGLVVLVGFLYVFLTGGEDEVKVNLETAAVRTVVASVSESGTIEPVIEVAIAADVSGEVVEMKGKEGEKVQEGDLLLTIRPDNYESALEQARAALNGALAGELQARANTESARSRYLQDSANFVRSNQLFQSKVIAETEWETAKLASMVSKSNWKAAIATEKSSRFQVSSSRASLKQAENNLDRTSIYATMTGTLTRLNVKKGERVVGTLQMAGTEVLRIADLSEMQITASINENDIRFLRVGDTAHIEVDAFEDMEFKGKVTDIAYSPEGDDPLSAATSSDQITNYKVKVLIDRNSYAKNTALMRGLPAHQSPFRPGMSAQVEIFTERRDGKIAVPIQAVTIRKPDDAEENADPEEVVFVYESGTVRKVPVKTGINDAKYIVIEEGISAGAQIVTGPYRVLSKELKDGMKVKWMKDRTKSGEEDAAAKEETAE